MNGRSSFKIDLQTLFARLTTPQWFLEGYEQLLLAGSLVCLVSYVGNAHHFTPGPRSDGDGRIPPISAFFV